MSTTSSKLGIVIPVYNVELYLLDCLNSIAKLSYTNFEAIIVNDGSTDSSGAIADKFAALDHRFTVIHQENGGLGKARNVGLAATTADFVCFPDSDDVVTPEGYGRLLESLLRTGAQYATGNVKRLEKGLVKASPLHAEIFNETWLATSLAAHSRLVWDSTAWNKVFRKSFFLEEVGQWPENVLYEDIAAMAKVAARASKVDVLSDDVYFWRQREDGSSITQDRTSVKNLSDRMLAVNGALSAITAAAPYALPAMQRKVLAVDLKNYLRMFSRSDEDYRTELLKQCSAIAKDIPADIISEQPFVWRGLYELLKAGEISSAYAFLNLPGNLDNRYSISSSGGSLSLVLPLDQSGTKFTRPLADLSKKLPFVFKVVSARHSSRGLWIDGYAYINGLSVLSPSSQVVRVFAKERGVGNIVEFDVRAVFVDQLAHSPTTKQYGWSGFQAFIPYDRLLTGALKRDTIFDLSINLMHGERTHQARISYQGRDLGKRRVLGEVLRVYCSPYRTSDLKLSVNVFRENFYKKRMEMLSSKIALAFVSPFRAAVAKVRRPKLVVASVASNALQRPVVVTANKSLSQEVITNTAPTMSVVAIDLSGGFLKLQLSRAPELGSSVGLLKDGSFETIELNGEGDSFSLDLMHAERAVGLMAPLPVGKFHLVLRNYQGSTPIAVPSDLIGTGPKLNRFGEIVFSLTKSGGGVSINSRTALPADQSGQDNQAKLHTNVYFPRLVKPSNGSIIFESWHGKRIDDHPKAIFDELVRRGDNHERMFVIENATTPVPAGVRTLRKWSREYWAALGEASAVVTNDSLHRYYKKRTGQTVLQTWHGTPLKKIGLDIENIHFASKSYKDDLPAQVALWDAMISPSRYVTDIYRTAFGFSGEMLEFGSPRNDLLLGPEAAEVRESTRRALNIPHGAKVVFYAPTWRDDQGSGPGKYGFDKALNLIRLVENRDDLYIIARGHHLMAHSLIKQQHPRLLEATFYPDVRHLLVAADVLITDYSSILVDFSLLRKPMISFAPDFEHYRENLRGFYIDFEADIPAPLVQDEDALISVIDDCLQGNSSHPRLQRWIEQFGNYERGDASSRTVDWLLGKIAG